MSLDKAIQHGKEHRREYRGSRSVARSCRHGGWCSWCQENRYGMDMKREVEKTCDELQDYGGYTSLDPK